jgi:ion channel-forming bestrophin family protein
MIIKRNLSPRRVLRYIAGPITWTTAWAVAVPSCYAITGASWLLVPFAPIGALGAALAIFIAFRNNTAFGRWNEARSAWQSVLVGGRVLARQVLASIDNAIAGGAEPTQATAIGRELVLRLVAFGYLLGDRIRPEPAGPQLEGLLPDVEIRSLGTAINPPNLLLRQQSIRIKDCIRLGVLGQFDPISLEPQLAALSTAQGVIERIKNTPTPRQYDYFTRRFVLLFAALAPFGILSLVTGSIWWTLPLSLSLGGVFVVMAVTGSANDEPFANQVTDVPIAAVCRELERDLRELLGDSEIPAAATPVNGYLW